MSEYLTTLSESIRQARKHICELKEVSPYLFGEWQRLQRAEVAHKEARIELHEAETAWYNLGN